LKCSSNTRGFVRHLLWSFLGLKPTCFRFKAFEPEPCRPGMLRPRFVDPRRLLLIILVNFSIRDPPWTLPIRFGVLPQPHRKISILPTHSLESGVWSGLESTLSSTSWTASSTHSPRVWYKPETFDFAQNVLEVEKTISFPS